MKCTCDNNDEPKDLKRWYITPMMNFVEPSEDNYSEDSELFQSVETTFSMKLSDFPEPPPLDLSRLRWVTIEQIAEEQKQQRLETGICNCGAPIHPDYDGYCSDCG